MEKGCKYCKYLIIHSPQGFSGIIDNTGWGTLPDCLRCSLQVMKEWVMMPPYTRRKKIDNIIVKINDTEIKQVESTKFLGIYSYFKKGCRREWRTANQCRTEVARPKGTVVTLFDTQSFTSCLWTFVWGFLTAKTKETHAFFQLQDLSRFFVWTAYCLRLYIATHKKFRNIALNCSFRNANWMLKNMDKPY